MGEGAGGVRSARGEVAVAVAAVTVAHRGGRLDEDAVSLVGVDETQVVGGAAVREPGPGGRGVTHRRGGRTRRRVGLDDGRESDLGVHGGVDGVGRGGGGGNEGGENERDERELHGVLLRAGWKLAPGAHGNGP